MDVTNFKVSMKRPKAMEQTRDWLKLPNDVMANILYRVGVIDILENAQKVCTCWREICKDPAMWKVLDIRNHWDPDARPALYEICKHAVDRSQGQLVDLTIVDVCSHEVLLYIADRASQLRRFEIIWCYGDLYDGWAECMEKFVALEELSLITTDFSVGDIESAGRYCPLLKTLKVNWPPFEDEYDKMAPSEYVYASDDVALAIGKNLPNLRHLELIGNSMTNIGLHAILDSCRHLESLDLRRCFHIDLKGGLGKQCSKQIKYLKLPGDPLDRSRDVTIEPKVYKKKYDDEVDDEDDEDDDDDDDGMEDDFIEDEDEDDDDEW